MASETQTERIDFKELDAQLACDVEGHVREWFHDRLIKRKGDWWRIGNKGGLAVHTIDGHWADFSLNEDKPTDKGAGLLSLYAWQTGKEAKEAAAELSDGSNVVPFKSKPSKPSKPKPKPRFELAMTPPEGKPQWWKTPSAQYEYKTREGMFVMVVARFDTDEGKDIRQASWLKDEKGEIGWQFKTAPLDKNLLYRGELLAANSDKPILIVEGEKCVEAVEGLLNDWLVLSWQGGSSTASKSDWSGLDGREVVIWPDNDDAGIKAANDIRQYVAHAKIVTPPNDKPKKWDLADAVAEGWKAEGILEEIKNAQETKDKDDLFDDIGHLWEGDIETALPTVGAFSTDKYLFYDAEVNEIHGEAGIAKTWIVLETMKQEMEKGNHVVYLDPESSAKKIVSRLRSMGANWPNLFHYKSTSFEEEATWQRYKHKVETLGATVVCLDGLVNFTAMRGSGEDDNAEAVKTLQTIAKPLAEGGAAVIVIDHTAKNKTTKGARGAGSKRGFYKGVSYHVESVKAFSKEKSGHVRLTVDKDNEGSVGAVGDSIAEFHCEVSGNGSTFFFCDPRNGGETVRPGRRPKLSDREFLDLLPEGKSNRVPFDNITNPQCNKQQFTARIKKLVDHGAAVEMCKDSSMTPKNHFWRE